MLSYYLPASLCAGWIAVCGAFDVLLGLDDAPRWQLGATPPSRTGPSCVSRSLPLQGFDVESGARHCR